MIICSLLQVGPENDLAEGKNFRKDFFLEQLFILVYVILYNKTDYTGASQ